MYPFNKKRDQRDSFQVKCTWCGTTIRVDTVKESEQMCLICYARMLNEYFQKVRNRKRNNTSGAHPLT